MGLNSKTTSKITNKTSYQSGVDAEKLCENFLIAHGFDILERRYKTKHGEIDVIAEIHGVLVFIEVKKRKLFGFDDPVSENQKKRIINAALQYISENPEISDHEMRFDCIFIDSHNLVTHIEDAWRT